MMEKVAVLQTGIATGVAGAAEAHEELLMTQNAIVVQKEEVCIMIFAVILF